MVAYIYLFIYNTLVLSVVLKEKLYVHMLVVLLFSTFLFIFNEHFSYTILPYFSKFKLVQDVGSGASKSFIYRLTSSFYASPTGVRSIEYSCI